MPVYEAYKGGGQRVKVVGWNVFIKSIVNFFFFLIFSPTAWNLRNVFSLFKKIECDIFFFCGVVETATFRMEINYTIAPRKEMESINEKYCSCCCRYREKWYEIKNRWNIDVDVWICGGGGGKKCIIFRTIYSYARVYGVWKMTAELEIKE